MEKIVLVVLFYKFSRFFVRKGKLANLPPFSPRFSDLEFTILNQRLPNLVPE